MTKHIAILVSCLIFCLTNLNLSSQATISVEFPSSGATNISLMPHIKISVNSPYKIDVSCLNLSDTIPYNNWDSVRNRHIISEMRVFPSSFYEGNDSTLQIALMFATYTKNVLINDSTFNILPFCWLEYETVYGIYIDDIRVYNPQTHDTLRFDTLFTPQFTTTLPMYRVENISSNGNVIRTGDIISIIFNRNLDSAHTPLGPIATIYKSDTTTINDTLRYIFNEVPSTSFMGDTSNIICVKPDTNYTLGNEYFLKVDLFGLTGDSSNNIFTTIPLKEKAMLNTLVKSLNALDTLPITFSPKMNTKTYFLEPNENLAFDVSKYDSNYFFVGWESPDYPYMNGITETSKTVSFTPEQLQDVDITAVYAKIHQDTIKLSSNFNGSFSAYTPGAVVNDSVYTLPRKGGDKMLLIANPSPQYKFSHWVSDDSVLNGNTNPYLEINAYPNVNELSTSGTWSDTPDLVTNIYPVFESDTSTCTMAQVCVTVSLEDGSEIFTGTSSDERNTDVKDLIEYVKVDNAQLTLFGANQVAYACLPIYNPNLPLSKTISVKLNSLVESRYEIAYYYDYGNKFNIQKGRKFPDYQNGDSAIGRLADPYGDSVGTQFSQPVTLEDPDKCSIDLKVVIYRRRCYLSTELMMEDTSYLPYPNVVNISFNGTRPGSIANTNLGNNLRNQQEWAVLDTDLQSMIFKKVTWYKIIPYGDTVYLQNQLLLEDRGFKSGYWYGDSGYTNTPINNNILTLNMIENKKTEYILSSDFVLLKMKISGRTFDTYDVIKGYPIQYPVRTRDNSFFSYIHLHETIDKPPYPNVHDNPNPYYPDYDTWKHEDINDNDDPNYQFKTALLELTFSQNVCENTLNDINCPMYDNQQPEEVNILCKGHGLRGYDIAPGMGILTIGVTGRWPKIEFYLIFPRFDGQPLKNYYYYYNSPLCSTIGKVVTMKIVSPLGFGLPHMSGFKIHVDSLIQTVSGGGPEAKKSKSGDNILNGCGAYLSNPGDAQFFTEYPNIEVRLLRIGGNTSIYQHEIILNLGTILKTKEWAQDQYNKYNDLHLWQILRDFQEIRLPASGWFNQSSGSINLTTDNIILSYHLNKELQWTVESTIFADDNTDILNNLNYTKVFDDIENIIYNTYTTPLSALVFADDPDFEIHNINKTYLKEHSYASYWFRGEIEGGWEKYKLDGNWGILAFPHVVNGKIARFSDPELDGIVDYNDKDRYRFLYLWRTYLSAATNIKYKIILK